jgi:hypothetical protein
MSSKTDNTSTTKNTTSESKKQEQEKTRSLPNGMTPENAKALNIMKTEGSDAAVKYMFNPTGERQLSYAEMRMRFG